MEKQQPRKAALLSIIPGLGQIYNKQKAKGFIFLGVTVLFVLYFLTLASPELSNLITLGEKPGRDNSLFMLIRGAFHSIFVVVYLLFYIFNIKDAHTTAKRINNGIPVARTFKDMIKGIYEDYFVNIPSERLTSSFIFVGILIVAVLLIIYFTTFVQQAEYKIPIQYTKVAKGAPSSSYLPLKVNPAGVIPVIFASSITAAPAAIFQVVSAMGYDADWVKTAQSLLATTTISGMFMYAFLIVLFTFFYTFVQINPEKTAENLQKSGAYIPGVRPGKGTEDYMSKLLRRLATVGSLFLGFISILPILAKDVFGLTDAVALGGTSLLIIISTGIEGMKQLEGYLLKRKYVGFMDTSE